MSDFEELTELTVKAEDIALYLYDVKDDHSFIAVLCTVIDKWSEEHGYDANKLATRLGLTHEVATELQKKMQRLFGED